MISRSARSDSYELALVYDISQRAARNAIDSYNGDLNRASEFLLVHTTTSPLDDLCALGGISTLKAQQYLDQADGKYDAAKERIIQGLT